MSVQTAPATNFSTSDSEVAAIIQRSVRALDGWITRNGWRGFDPHDIRGKQPFLFLLQPLNSVPLKIARRLALTPLTAFESSFPGVARQLFGVEPTINAKGMALFSKAYLQLFFVSGDEKYKAKAIECLDWLAAHPAPGFDEPGWGYPFFWQSGVITPPNTPASVVTSAVGDAFWTAYQILGDSKYLELCAGICRFFLKHLNRDEMPDGTLCFSYTPIDDFHVHNANLLVAEFLVRIGKETQNNEWVETGIRAGSYALAEQNPDGSLYYWGRVQNSRCRNCIDQYHSGFEIRCLFAIGQLTNRADFQNAAKNYYKFYCKSLIEKGPAGVRPKMTPSSFYPVNIHSCAESILLAATLADTFPEARETLDPLARWVLSSMQNPDGSFAYMRRQRWGREVVSDFPYLRWGQGWMLLALSQYLVATRQP